MAAGAGRPVRKRKDYAADVSALGRLRTALTLDARIASNEKTKALSEVDKLMESLVAIHENLEPLRKAG